MEKRGQITLETAVLILLAINIFAYITMPVARVSQAAAEAVGTAALAEKAVNSIVNTANLVGIGGKGAKSSITVYIARDFKGLSCSGTAVVLSFENISRTNVYDSPNTFGVREEINLAGDLSYGQTSDFVLVCNFGSVIHNPPENDKVDLCFENKGGKVEIDKC